MTQHTCIAIVDASRARLFVHTRSVDPSGTNDAFIEHADLVDPARRLAGTELFSDTRTNSGVAANGHHYGIDDHRAAHIDQLDTEFAREIVAKLEALVTETSCHRVVLCASPHMLGTLRDLLGVLRELAPIDELARDFVKLTPPELRVQLAAHGLLARVPDRSARAV